MPFLAPLIGAIGGAVSGIGALLGSTALGGGLGGLLLKTATVVGLNLLASVFTPTATQASGVELDVKYGDETPRTIALGTVASKGQFIYADSYGESNRHAAYVFKLADWRTTGIRRVAFEGAWYDLDTTATSRGFRVLGIDAEIYVRFYDGTQQTANNELVNNAPSTDRWDENSIMTGCSYVIVTGTYDQEHLPTMGDILLFEYDGAPLYDPRKDSTRGGSGTHRIDDTDTWEFSRNPALMMLNLELGFYTNGELMAGKGMPISRMPLAKWALAASICDEIVDSEARYEASLIAQSGEGSSHLDNLEPILRACAGAYYHDADGPFVYVGANRTPVATITDDDFLFDEDYTFSTKQSRANLVNYLSGTYIDPEKFWETVSYEPVLDDVAFAQDRERLSKALSFSAVSRRTQAERLRDIFQRANRYQKTASIPLRLRWLVLEPGDWIEFQSDRFPSSSGTYEVKNTTIRSLSAPQNPLAVGLELDEVGEGIFDPTQYSLEQPIILPRGRIVTNALQGFDATPTNVTSQGGGTYPAFRLTWGAIDDETISRIQVQYWPTDQPNSRVTVNVEPDQLDVLVQENVVPLTEYTFRHRLLSVPKRTIPWVDGGTATSGAGAFEASQLAEVLAAADEAARVRVDAVNARADDLFDYTSEFAWIQAAEQSAYTVRFDRFEQNFGNLQAQFIEQVNIRVEENLALVETTELLNARIGNNEAVIREERRARISSDGALAEQTEVLGVRVDDNQSAIVNEAQARADADNALAESVTGVQSRVDGVTGDGLFGISSTASSNGATVDIDLLARVSTNDNFVQSGLFIRASKSGSTTTSQVIINTDEFIVRDGNNEAPPFVYQGGTLYLNGVKVNAADIENLTVDFANVTGTLVVDETAQIANAIIGTSNLDFNAVTDLYNFDLDTGTINNSTSGRQSFPGSSSSISVAVGQAGVPIKIFLSDIEPTFSIPGAGLFLVVFAVSVGGNDIFTRTYRSDDGVNGGRGGLVATFTPTQSNYTQQIDFQWNDNRTNENNTGRLKVSGFIEVTKR